MKKISFDGGKTLVDIMDDSTFSMVVSKLRKAKNWNVIIDAMEADALLNTSYRGSTTTVESRVQILAEYLKNCSHDLIVKIK